MGATISGLRAGISDFFGELGSDEAGTRRAQKGLATCRPGGTSGPGAMRTGRPTTINDAGTRDAALIHILRQRALSVPDYYALSRVNRALRDVARGDAKDLGVVVRTYAASLRSGPPREQFIAAREVLALVGRSGGGRCASLVVPALADILCQKSRTNCVVQSIAGRGIVWIAAITEDPQVRAQALGVAKEFITRPLEAECSGSLTRCMTNELAGTLMMLDLFVVPPSRDRIDTLLQIADSPHAAWETNQVTLSIGHSFSRACGEFFMGDSGAFVREFGERNRRHGRYANFQCDPPLLHRSNEGYHAVTCMLFREAEVLGSASVLREVEQVVGLDAASMCFPRVESAKAGSLGAGIRAAREAHRQWLDVREAWYSEDPQAPCSVTERLSTLARGHWWDHFSDYEQPESVENLFSLLEKRKYRNIAEDCLRDLRCCMAVERLANNLDPRRRTELARGGSVLQSYEVSSCFSRWFTGGAVVHAMVRDGRLLEEYSHYRRLRMAGDIILTQLLSRPCPLPTPGREVAEASSG